MASAARRWMHALRRPLLFIVGVFAVMGGIGFAVGGWNGTQGGLLWAAAGVGTVLPGLVVSVFLTIKYGPPSDSYHRDDY